MNDQGPKSQSDIWKDIKTPLAAMAGVTALILVVWLGSFRLGSRSAPLDSALFNKIAADRAMPQAAATRLISGESVSQAQASASAQAQAAGPAPAYSPAIAMATKASAAAAVGPEARRAGAPAGASGPAGGVATVSPTEGQSSFVATAGFSDEKGGRAPSAPSARGAAKAGGAGLPAKAGFEASKAGQLANAVSPGAPRKLQARNSLGGGGGGFGATQLKSFSPQAAPGAGLSSGSGDIAPSGVTMSGTLGAAISEVSPGGELAAGGASPQSAQPAQSATNPKGGNSGSGAGGAGMTESDRVCRSAVDSAQAKNREIQKHVDKLVEQMNSVCPADMKCGNQRYYCTNRWFKHTSYCSCANLHCSINKDCEKMNANTREARKSCPKDPGRALPVCNF